MKEFSCFGIFGRLATHPGRRDDVVAVFERGEAVLQGMPGCRLYLIGTSENEPDSVFVTEIWDDQEAHEASLQIPEVRGMIQQTMPLLDLQSMRQTTFVPVAGFGLALT